MSTNENDLAFPQRQSIRLPDYNYSADGAYFITICTHQRECLFGNIGDLKMMTNIYGDIVLKCWKELQHHYSLVTLDAFQIMPNHVHGIVLLETGSEKSSVTRRTLSLPEIVRALKTFSSRRINKIRETPGVPLWQRSFYEHVIRNERDLLQIREYVANNPMNWGMDEENLLRQGEKE